MENTSKLSSFAIPAAIVIAGGLIAGAVYLSGQSGAPSANTGNPPPTAKVSVPAVTKSDHVLGDVSKAKVVMIEYSDLECPFCKNYQATLHQAVAEYGDKVAWVYRHFNVHTAAVLEAQASECAAELGGNDKFFQYIDKIFAVTKSDNQLPPAVLTSTAVELGLDRTQFQACLDSGKYKALVDQQSKDAVSSGGQGTPYTVLVTKKENYPITEGAIPYASLKSAIDALLAK